MSSSRARSARFPLFVLRLSFAFGLALSLWSGRPTEATVTYRVAIDREYAPYEFVDEAGQVQGFTPALLNAIGESAGVRFEFAPMAWPEAVAALDSGAVDLVNMIVTPARATHYEFSQPHSQIVQAVFRNTNASDIVSLESLAGKTVAFQSGGVALEQLAGRTDIERHLVQSKLEGLLHLNTGQAQAFIGAQQPGVRLVSEYQLTNVELAVADLFPQAYAFAARKGNTALIALLDEHLARLRASGELETLTTHWLKGQLPQPSWLEKNQSAIFLLGGILLLGLLAIWVWSITLRREVRRQTQALRESEARFRHMADTAPVLIWLSGTDKLRAYFSQPWLEFTGRGMAEEMGLGWTTGLHPEDYDRCLSVYDSAFDRREKFQREYRLRRADGEYRWVVESGVPRFTPTGEFLGYIGSCIDITERRQTEDELRTVNTRLKTLIDHLHAGVLVEDEHRRILHVNQRFCDLFAIPVPPEQLLGADCSQSAEQSKALFLTPAGFVAGIEALLTTRQTVLGDVLLLADGRIFERDYVPIYLAGEYVGHLWQYRDVTERQRAAEALRANEEHLRRITDHMLDLVSQVDGQGTFRYVSPSLQTVLGYTPEDLLGQSALSFIHPDDVELASSQQRLMNMHGTPGPTTFRFRHAAGNYVWLEASLSPLLDAQGQVNGAVFGARDVTERKRAEAALRENAAILQSIFDNGQVMMGVIEVVGDDDARYVAVNNAVGRFLGHSLDAIHGRLLSDLNVPPAIRRLWVKRYHESQTAGRPISFEYRRETLTGERWVLATVHGIAPPRYSFVMVDITERKHMEDALRESEMRYRLLAENMADVVWVLNVSQMRFTYLSPSVQRLRGYTVEEVLAQPMEEVLTPASLAKLGAILPERLRQFQADALGARFFTDEMEQPHKNGSIVNTEVTTSYLRNAHGEIEIIGVSRDITERKQATAALAASEAGYRGLFNSVSEAIYIQDEAGRFLDVNRGAQVMYGYPREFFLGRTPNDLAAPGRNDLVAVGEKVSRALAGELQELEFWGQRANGEAFPKEVRLQTGTYFGRNVLITVARDITERKRAEEALRESEARYRSVFEQSFDGILLTAPDGRTFAANPQACRLFGRSEAEICRLDRAALVDANDPRLQRALTERLTTGRFRGELTFLRADGSSFPGELASAMFTDQNGDPRASIIFRDITERKRAEEALRESEARFRRIAENMPVLLDAFSADNRLLLWNRECERVTGYTAAELVDNPRALEILYPDPAYRESKLAEFALLADEYRNVEWEVTCKDGQKRTIAWSSISQTVTIPGWNTWGVGVDVTERKRMEEALRDAAVYTRSLIEASLDPLVTINIEGKITDVNRATESVTGVSREWLIGRDFSDYFTEPEKARAGYRQVFADGSVTDYALAIRHVSGRITEVLYNASVYRNEAGAVLGVFAAARDITERKRAEEALRASEARQRATLDAIPDLMVVLSYPEGVYLEYHTPNPAFLLAPPNQLLGHRMDEFLVPELALELTEALRQAVETGQTQVHEYAIDTPRGRLLEEARAVAIDSAHVLFVIRDVTARKQAEAQVRASLREKEVLLKEVHHRVKNNLQVMVSLLNLQAEQIRDPHSLAIFRDSQERVRSMALVHEKLYQSPDLARINFAEYLAELAGNLKQIFGLQPEVEVCVEAEEMWLGVDTAIPCGLIVNELVSNALKYAYPEGRAGKVRVVLRAMPASEHEFRLTVSDDGVGLPPALDPAHTQTLGLQLVHLLTHQLRGAVAVKREGGVTFDITFAERKEYRP